MVKKVKGTPIRPRLYVFRSHQHIYAQVIDDVHQITLASSSSISPELKGQIKSSNTCAASEIVGTSIAEKCKSKGINKIVFDRGNKLYHGRIKALANAARKGGIEF